MPGDIEFYFQTSSNRLADKKTKMHKQAHMQLDALPGLLQRKVRSELGCGTSVRSSAAPPGCSGLSAAAISELLSSEVYGEVYGEVSDEVVVWMASTRHCGVATAVSVVYSAMRWSVWWWSVRWPVWW